MCKGRMKENGMGKKIRAERKEQMKKKSNVESAKLVWGLERKEQEELFNFHSHSQMCSRQDIVFKELVAK